MVGLMQRALGADWHRLSPALQAHYREGVTVEAGHLDIEFPRFMFPFLTLLALLGALVNRRGSRLPTVVERRPLDERLQWRRRITFPGGQVAAFDSHWVAVGGNELVEFVNPVLGLQMAVWLDGPRLRYRGVRYIVQLGRWRLPVPAWLAPGDVDIVEEALDPRRYAMDFRVRHRLFGQVFRYSGVFEVDVGLSATSSEPASSPPTAHAGLTHSGPVPAGQGGV